MMTPLTEMAGLTLVTLLTLVTALTAMTSLKSTPSTNSQRLASIYQQKLLALAALKKSLLHQAFSGEL